MPTYRPRMAATLTVPYFGTSAQKDKEAKGTATVEVPLKIRRAELTRNDHNHADELELSVDWSSAGVDPRFLKNATVHFWMGNVEAGREFVPSDDNLRFIGILTRARRQARSEGGLSVELSFLDYTRLFIECKPFPTAGVPSYQDTLVSAWHKICDFTGWAEADNPTHIFSSVAALRDRLVFQLSEGIDQNLVLSKACSERFASFAKVPIRPEADAWEVWLYVTGMLGLISFIDRDKVIVTDSVEYYSEKTAPRLVWGKNILAADETVNGNFTNKGICMCAFDPLSGRNLEAFWPPFFSENIQKKNVVAVSKKLTPGEQQSDRYDYFAYPGVTNPDALLAIAKGAYEQRSRQEIEGGLRTGEMSVEDEDGDLVDLLNLTTGDCIRIEIGENSKEYLSSKGSIAERKAYLVDLGYDDSVAELISQNLDPLGQLLPVFHVKTVRTILDISEDSGRFEVDINYVNRINVKGDTEGKTSG